MSRFIGLWRTNAIPQVLVDIWVKKYGKDPIKRLNLAFVIGNVLGFAGIAGIIVGYSRVETLNWLVGFGASALLAGALTLLISRFACEFLNHFGALCGHLGFGEHPEQMDKYYEQPLRVRAANRLKEQAAVVRQYEGPGLDPFSDEYLIARDQFEERYGLFLLYGLIRDVGYGYYFNNAPSAPSEPSLVWVAHPRSASHRGRRARLLFEYRGVN